MTTNAAPSPLPRIILFAACVLILALAALIVKASFEKSLATIFVTLLSDTWGIVTLIDLYAGFFVVAAWIAAIERNALRSLLWLIALLCLGNLATLVYVALRARRARTWREIFIPASPAPAQAVRA